MLQFVEGAMNDETEFLSALAAAPDDATVYAAFADGLEERGEGE